MKEGSMPRSNWKMMFGSNGTLPVPESGVVNRIEGGWLFLPLVQDGPRTMSNPQRTRGGTDRQAERMDASLRTNVELYGRLRILSRGKPPFRRENGRIRYRRVISRGAARTTEGRTPYNLRSG